MSEAKASEWYLGEVVGSCPQAALDAGLDTMRWVSDCLVAYVAVLVMFVPLRGALHGCQETREA